MLKLWFLVALVLHTYVGQASPCDPLAIGETPEITRAIGNLAALILKVDTAKAEGSLSPATTALARDLQKKETELVNHLESNGVMSRVDLRQRLRYEITRLQQSARQQAQHDEIFRKTHQDAVDVIDGTRAIFHRIEPGSFKMGDGKRYVDVELTRPFEMMATPVTQMIWRQIAELANSTTKDHIPISAEPSANKGPTNPVESVNPIKIQEWINALNTLSANGDPRLEQVIRGHRQGVRYRLPTEAEWEFVSRARGTSAFFVEPEYLTHSADTGDYIWHKGNSGGRTQPVAQKKPISVGGKPFYDLQGNVWELMLDGFRFAPPGGKDPMVSRQADGLFVLRGGSHLDEPAETRFWMRVNDASGTSGFRLVREVR